jgi:hypothetical protein
VEKGPAASESMMQAYFLNGVKLSFPFYPAGNNFTLAMVEANANGDWNGELFYHIFF